MKKRAHRPIRKHLIAPIGAAILLILLIIIYFRLTPGAQSLPTTAAQTTLPPVLGEYVSAPQSTQSVPVPAQEEPVAQTDAPAPSETEAPLPAISSAGGLSGKLRISEVMVKNHASLRDEQGDFSDWIELENLSGESISLDGLCLSDDEGSPGWCFGAVSIAPGERLLVFADGKDISSPVAHTDFSLSKGETLRLVDQAGDVIDSFELFSGSADISLALNDKGEVQQCAFPSPGYENSEAGYLLWQEGLDCASPLIISEIMVYNDSLLRQNGSLGSVYCDWVELTNVSGDNLELSDYCISDDEDDKLLYPLPQRRLSPGQSVIILCSTDSTLISPSQPRLDFDLASDGEQLFLSRGDGTLMDHVFVHDVPYGCSFGRISGEKGWFFIDSPSPGKENTGGARLIAQSPLSLSADGVFNDVEQVTVTLSAPGTIHYSTDGSRPTQASPVYTGPVSVTATTVIRAVAFEEGKLPSAPLNLSFIINEGHSLPVLSLVSDNPTAFYTMYNSRNKDLELPGALALYREDGGFSIACGIEMHGQTSLALPKKNLSVRFRAAYGQEELSYDAFGGGVTEFTNFLLRSGQDFSRSIIRNELLQNLGLQMGDNMLNQRSIHCVLYINGEYSGIYTLTEKLNESHYAKHRLVSRDSVTVVKSTVSEGSAFYKEVIRFALNHDLSLPENYEQFCRLVDIDSLIDWIIIEGYSANSDIYDSNVRYCRSTEDDGRWRFMLYDMDATMSSSASPYANVLRPASTECSVFIVPLMKNEAFRHRFLSRAGEVLNTVLTNENVVMELDRLTALVSPEVDRDYARFNYSRALWESEVEHLRNSILAGDWRQKSIEALCSYFMLSDDERAAYFGP